VTISSNTPTKISHRTTVEIAIWMIVFVSIVFSSLITGRETGSANLGYAVFMGLVAIAGSVYGAAMMVIAHIDHKDKIRSL
jgi:hypothetical protein